MSDDTQRRAIHAYLVGLYGETPNGLLWIGGHADGWKGRTFTGPDAAAAYAVELDARGGQGVYHRSTTLARRPEKRGEAADSAMVHYFALDIDVAGPGHKAADLPATFDQAVELIEKAGFPAPTVWIHSGGGYYPQWRFTEPIDVREGEKRRWVTFAFADMAAHFVQVAKAMGWHLDNVRDLARVFRLPGTTNRKAEPVTAKAVDGSGETFALGALASIAYRATTTRPPESAPSEAPGSDELFDDAKDTREFTRAQAKDWLKRASAKLGEATAGYNSAINEFAMTCAHFPWLVDRDACARQMIKVLGPRLGWTAPDAADEATINSAYSATEAGRSWTAVERPEAEVSDFEATVDGNNFPQPAQQLPPPSRPHDVAEAIAPGYPGRLRWWRGAWYRHAGDHYRATGDDTVENWAWAQFRNATFLQPVKPKKGDEGGKPEFEEVPWGATPARVNGVMRAMSRAVVQRSEELDDDRGLIFANGVYDLDADEVLPHSNTRFNLTRRPYDYQPEADCPAWYKFLNSSLPGMYSDHDFIQEFFGYVLEGRTDLQKAAGFIGKTGAGKGTAAQVLTALVGEDATTGVEMSQFSQRFGMAPFIGRELGIISEPKWATPDAQQAVDPIKRITGNDKVSIDRKNGNHWEGRLGIRFLVLANEVPRLVDRAGALARRFVYVQFPVSFDGAEDTGLERKLLTEMPGIANWAIRGARRLREQGRFTVPSSHQDVADSVRMYADPDEQFVQEACMQGEGVFGERSEIFGAYRTWCKAVGRYRDGTEALALMQRLDARDGLKYLRTEDASASDRLRLPHQKKLWGIRGLLVDRDKVIELERQIGMSSPDRDLFTT